MLVGVGGSPPVERPNPSFESTEGGSDRDSNALPLANTDSCDQVFYGGVCFLLDWKQPSMTSI